jgi:hypothetical protein
MAARIPLPSTWRLTPAGWYCCPLSDVPTHLELSVRKNFSFMNHAAQYFFIGASMALADELKVYPKLEWLYSELSATIPFAEGQETLAAYMNDLETSWCGNRNLTGHTGNSTVLWSSQLKERAESRARNEFCLMLTSDQKSTEKFLTETYVQWQHRADYLVTRKSRDKQDYRQDLTLQKVMQNGQERKRRMQQRKVRAEQSEAEAVATGNATKWDNFSHDVLPREVREMLDKESDGLEDFRMARGMAPSGATTRRTLPNSR